MDYLEALTHGASQWAKAYVAVTDALIKHGVDEQTARGEAQSAANFAISVDADGGVLSREGNCPLCGK